MSARTTRESVFVAVRSSDSQRLLSLLADPSSINLLLTRSSSSSSELRKPPSSNLTILLNIAAKNRDLASVALLLARASVTANFVTDPSFQIGISRLLMQRSKDSLSKSNSLFDAYSSFSAYNSPAALLLSLQHSKVHPTPLALSCYSGCETTVKLLLDEGADPDILSIDPKYYTDPDFQKNDLALKISPLAIACREDYRDTINILLKSGANVNCDSHTSARDSNSPLMIACASSNSSLSLLLLESGADPHIINAEGKTPLYFASKDLYIPVVKALLDLGCDVNHATDMVTALNNAVDSPELVSLLLEYGAEPTPVDTALKPPLYDACLRNKLDTLQLLLEAGADPESQWKEFNSILFYCLELRRSVPFFQILISFDANVNADGGHKGSLLYQVLSSNLYQQYVSELVMIFLKAGADPFCDSQINFSPLLFLASERSSYIARAFRECNVNMNHIFSDGRTLLSETLRNYSLTMSFIKIFKLSVDEGSGKVTPLVVALNPKNEIRISPRTVEILIQRGARKYVNDAEYGPMILAAAHCYSAKILKSLKNIGGNPRCVDKNGNTGFHILAQRNFRYMCHSHSVFQFFLDAGAPLDAVNINGFTAFHLAMKHRNMKLAFKMLDVYPKLSLIKTSTGQWPLELWPLDYPAKIFPTRKFLKLALMIIKYDQHAVWTKLMSVSNVILNSSMLKYRYILSSLLDQLRWNFVWKPEHNSIWDNTELQSWVMKNELFRNRILLEWVFRNWYLDGKILPFDVLVFNSQNLLFLS
ncbi:hypothetical protein HK096_000190 [Nowakowskiella sp. JEL0078]|nr:hypothetical protein HK096_000190 [Nowakowskiella sp. JEL0078]